MKIEMLEGMVKARKGNYVVYDIDYLMEHLAKEVCLLQRYRVNKQRCKQLDYEAVLKEVREGMFADERCRLKRIAKELSDDTKS